MPIFEFKCSDCEEFFEILVMNKDDEREIKCPKCKTFAVERVVSRTNFTMGGSSSTKNQTVTTQERNCSSGSCSTYTIPGESQS